MNESLRTLLAQARLHVRRAQSSTEPGVRLWANDECDKACALIDHVMRKLDDEGRLVADDGKAAE